MYLYNNRKGMTQDKKQYLCNNRKGTDSRNKPDEQNSQETEPCTTASLAKRAKKKMGPLPAE